MTNQSKKVPKLRFPGFRSEWHKKRLEDLAYIERGRFSPRPRNDPRYYGGDIPFVQTGDVTRSNGLVRTYSQTLNDKGQKVSKVFPKGTILITIAANIGHAAILEIDMACPDSLVGIRTKEGTSNRFLNHYLSTQQQRMDRIASEAAQKNINIEFLRPYPVPSTSIKEQSKIADYLDLIDRKVVALEGKKGLLEKYKKGVMQAIFTQKVRLEDESGNKYSAQWQKKRLNEIAVQVSRTTEEIDDLEVLTISAGQGFITQNARFSQVIAGNSLERYVVLECGGFSYNRGASKKFRYGCVYMQRSYDSALVPNIYKSFSFKAGIVPEFYAYLFTTGFIDSQLRKFISSSARMDGLLNISSKDFYSIVLPVPSFDEQRKIADFLKVIDDKIKLEEEKLEQAKKFKQALLQQMFV